MLGNDNQNGEYLKAVASMLRWRLPEELRLHIQEVEPSSDTLLELPDLTIEIDSGNPVSRLIRGSQSESTPGFYEAFPRFGLPRMLLPSKTQQGERAALIRPRAKVDRRKAAAGRAFVQSDRLLQAFSVSVRTRQAEGPAFVQNIVQHGGVRTAIYRSYDRLSLRRFDLAGNLKTIVKYVDTPADRQLASNEFECLKQLHRIPVLRDRTPTPLDLVTDTTSTALITRPLQGDPTPPEIVPPISDFLKHCELGPNTTVASSSHIRTLRDEIWSTHHTTTFDRAMFEKSLDVISHLEVKRTFLHGDFIPWNIVLEKDRANVFDWEYATPDGIPEWDRIFFILQSGLHMLGWDATRVVESVQRIAAEGSPHYDAPALCSLSNLVLLQIGLRLDECDRPTRMPLIRSAMHQLQNTQPL